MCHLTEKSINLILSHKWDIFTKKKTPLRRNVELMIQIIEINMHLKYLDYCVQMEGNCLIQSHRLTVLWRSWTFCVLGLFWLNPTGMAVRFWCFLNSIKEDLTYCFFPRKKETSCWFSMRGPAETALIRNSLATHEFFGGWASAHSLGWLLLSSLPHSPHKPTNLGFESGWFLLTL